VSGKWLNEARLRFIPPNQDGDIYRQGYKAETVPLDELVCACAELSDADTLAVLLDYRDGESVAETLARSQARRCRAWHAPAEQLSLEEHKA